MTSSESEPESSHGLDPVARDALLAEQGECTLAWSTRDGWPVAVTMAYLWRDGRFWLVTEPGHPRVLALRRDPRVSIVVRAPARSVTAKGRCILRDDAEARGWVYRELAAHQGRLFPALIDPATFERGLLEGERAILEIVPEQWITYDGTVLYPAAGA
jgi:hypothetical protein